MARGRSRRTNPQGTRRPFHSAADGVAPHDLYRFIRFRHRNRGHGTGRRLSSLPRACGRMEGEVTNLVSRMRVVLTVVMLGLTLSACGYNTIPTLEEQAKARWSDVQNQYQRRADLIPNLVATVQGYAAQEKSVLTSVIEARAKATQVKLRS